MAAQQEYALGYTLAFCMVLLGILVVCIPRPRKAKYLTEKEAEKEKRLLQKKKAASKKKRAAEKAKRKAAKAKAKGAKKKAR
ncbi:MAG: hypothetical protein AAFN77_08120 [Planctomycetota bacterium]